MDSINSVFNQYVSGTANESSCDVRGLCQILQMMDPEIVQKKKKKIGE